MKFIKGGIVTRIDYDEKELDFLSNYFNFDLYNINDNSLLLKEEELIKNFKCVLGELLTYTNNLGNAILDSDTFVLEANYDDLRNNKICLDGDNKKYYYEMYKDNKFDTLMSYESINNHKFRIYFIPLIWDIHNINIESVTLLIIFINNLIRKALGNPLKDTLWFTLTK